jgi:oligoribonuclease NrnB/cAMP/cGMP phosphodiesterase (DHH superfamily)
MDTVLFHNSCPDGWCSAYIAKKKYPEAELIALDHGKSAEYIDTLIQSLRGKDVLMTDFSFRTRLENDNLAAVAKSFRILDHHLTAQAVLTGVSYATFDMNRSGAGLAWDYLFGKDATDLMYRDGSNFQEERPWFVNFVEDRDLWRNTLPNAKEVSAYLMTQPYTVEAWDDLANIKIEEAVTYGTGALRQIEYYVKNVVKNRQLGTIDGLTAGIANAQYISCSEIGHELANESQVGITWFERGDGVIQFSLRSVGDIDVSAIAKRRNGGGHKNASGFQLSVQAGRDLVDRIIGRDSIVAGPRHG